MELKVHLDLPEDIGLKVKQFDTANFDIEETEDPEFEEDIAEHYFAPRFATVIAYIDDEIVGTSSLRLRTIEFEGKKVFLGGQGGITVSKDKRKQGIGTQLLKRSIEVFHENNCDIAFLNTDIEILGHIFEKIGYKVYPREYFYIGKSGKQYSDNNAMLAPVNSREIFDVIMDSDMNLDIGESNI